MNAELPPFKNGEHNSESASTIDRDITPLKQMLKGFTILRCFNIDHRQLNDKC